MLSLEYLYWIEMVFTMHMTIVKWDVCAVVEMNERARERANRKNEYEGRRNEDTVVESNGSGRHALAFYWTKECLPSDASIQNSWNRSEDMRNGRLSGSYSVRFHVRSTEWVIEMEQVERLEVVALNVGVILVKDTLIGYLMDNNNNNSKKMLFCIISKRTFFEWPTPLPLDVAWRVACKIAHIFDVSLRCYHINVLWKKRAQLKKDVARSSSGMSCHSLCLKRSNVTRLKWFIQSTIHTGRKSWKTAHPLDSLFYHSAFCNAPVKRKKTRKKPTTKSHSLFSCFVLHPGTSFAGLWFASSRWCFAWRKSLFFVLGEKLSRKYKLSSCKCIICVERIQRVTDRTRI